MGTQLSIIGKHTFSEEFTKEKIVHLAYSIADSFVDKFNLAEDKRGIDNFEIILDKDFKKTFFHIYVDCIGNGIWLYVYENTFVIDSYYKFHNFVYDAKAGTDKDAGIYKDFRKDIFDMIQLMNCNKVIYLCDTFSNRDLSHYSNDIMEGASFDDVEQKLIKRYGKPITDLNKIDKNKEPLTFYNRLNEFVVDSFEDLIKSN